MGSRERILVLEGGQTTKHLVVQVGPPVLGAVAWVGPSAVRSLLQDLPTTRSRWTPRSCSTSTGDAG
jgi:hypothetical protein